jgi:hypothetical protein
MNRIRSQGFGQRFGQGFGRLLLVGSLAFATGAVAQDQANPAAVSDAQVEANVLRALASAPELSNQNIQSSSVYGVVTLTGNVHDDAMRSRAENLVARAAGVKKVVDEMSLGDAPPADQSADQTAANQPDGEAGPPDQGQQPDQAGPPPQQPDPMDNGGLAPVQPSQQAQQQYPAQNGYPNPNQGQYPDQAQGQAGPPPNGQQYPGGYGPPQNGNPSQTPNGQYPNQGQYPDQAQGQNAPPPNGQQYPGGYGPPQNGYPNQNPSQAQQQYPNQGQYPDQGQPQPYGPPDRRPLYQNNYPPQDYAPQGGQQAGLEVTVPSGSLLRIRINRGLDSNHIKPGTPFDGTVLSDIPGGGAIAIPRGAFVQGTVVDAQKTGAVSGHGELGLAINSVTLGGVTYPITTDVWQRQGRDKTASTVGHALGLGVLGAVIGGVAGGGAGAAVGAGIGAGAGVATSAGSPGGRVIIPPEAVLTFHIAQPAVVRTVSEQEMLRLAAGAGAQAPRYNPYGYAPRPY